MLPPRQEVISLRLPPSIRQRLLSAGFRTCGDLEGVTAAALAAAAGLVAGDAEEVLQEALGTPGVGWRLQGAISAADLLSAQAKGRRIRSGCNELDELLGGGGVATGSVSEFCGVPGVGKTQLGIQLAVNAQLPVALGGLGATAIYIDTEGSFMADRVVDIAAGAVAHAAAEAAHLGTPQAAAAAAAFSVDTILEGILHFRVQDAGEQLALGHMLPHVLAQQQKVALVIVDSVTFHFRQDFDDMAGRARVLAGLAQQAAELAEAHDVAVVYMNQVTTRITEGREGSGQLVPALGETWGQAASTRVILHWEGSQRWAHLIKSPGRPARRVPYQVTAEGVRGM